MGKHTSKEAYFERLQDLAEVRKPSLKESRNLGTLIDYKRAADGVAYGIVKENHHYYLKKGGMKESPDASDFAYIGGIANITEYQYKKLSEAGKHRNMILATINEAVSLKPSKTGSRKKVLTEDKAKQEIDMAASKVDDLDTATEISAEPESPVDIPTPEGGEEPMEKPAPEGDDEINIEAEPDSDVDVNIDEPENGEEPEGDETGSEEPIGDEDEKSLIIKDIEKGLGRVTTKIRKTELEPSQVKSYVNSFLSAFKDKFDEVEIEDRKEMADKILKVVPDEDVEDLGDEISQETEIEESQCDECGGFGKYAESRGYSLESIKECGEEEMASLMSGYANAHDEGMNDGDLKLVALLASPEITDKLKDEYGHEDYTEKLTPYTNQMSESNEEEKEMQINELWGGLKGAAQKVGGDIKGAAQKAGQAVKGAAQKAGQAVGQYATDVKQSYHTGEVANEIKKLEKVAQDLGKQAAALNTRLEKAGKQPVNVQSLLTTIKNQLAGGAGSADLSRYGVAEGLTDPASIEVQPNMVSEEDDEFTGEEDEFTGEKDVVADEKPMNFAPDSQNLGADVMKPDGAPTSEKEIEIKDSTVNISMTESEKKVRKYIRERLEIKTGLRKENLNEDKKSDTLKKLDRLIEAQFNSYQDTFKKKKK